MKFVCERCQTKYSIADEKVRGKVLKVRCKSCSNVITVREQGGTVAKAADDANDDFSTHDSGRTAITSAAELQRRHAETMKAMEGAKAQGATGRQKTGPLAAIPAEALSAPGTPKAAPPSRTGTGAEEPIWFLAVDGNQTGPFTPLQLVDKILLQPKGADVHVWNPTLGDWRPPASVPEVHAQLEKKRRPAAPPPPPATARRAGPPMPSGAPAPSVPAMPSVTAASAASKAPVLPTGRASKHHEVVKPTELEELLLEPSSPTRSGAPSPAADHGFHAGSVASSLAPSLGEAASNRHAGMETFGSPERPLGSTESDALDALSFVPRPDPQTKAASAMNGAAAVALSDAADASRATGSEAFFAKVSPTPPHLTGGSELMQLGGRRHRNVKLGFGLAAVVVVVGSVVALAVLRQPVSTANAEKSKTPTSGTDFAVLAQKLAEEQAQAPASGPPSTTPPSSGEPSKVVIPGRTPPSARRPPSRLPSMPRGTLTGTTPPPLELSAEANRGVGRAIDGEMRVPILHSGGGPKSTPSQADITRVINNNRSGIQTCYQRALMRDNTLKHGKVNIGITVGISGKVKKVTMDASPQFRSLEPCIREVVQRWAFPSSSEEYDTEFPVVLQGNE